MVPGLGSVLDRLEGLFGRTYLLAGFLPAMVLFSAGVAVSAWVGPGATSRLRGFLAQPATEQAPYWFASLLLVAVAGLILWSLNTYLRELLEGRHWPRPSHACSRATRRNCTLPSTSSSAS